MTRRPSEQALRQAARIAREEGVAVRLERTSDSWAFVIAPDITALSPATDREVAACDEAFGGS